MLIEIKDYKFRNINLLRMALTHPSVDKNKSHTNSYERMEFLGDSILNTIISNTIYHKFFQYSEGYLSIILANLVNTTTIVKVAKNLELDKKIIIDSGEEKCGGRQNPNNLENVLEAVIASIYLDSNFNTVQDIVNKWWEVFLLDTKKLIRKNYKSQLQEILQKKYKVLPIYKTQHVSGFAHKPIFTISVSLKDKYVFVAKGEVKKEAEQKAAKKMLTFIDKIK